MKTKLMNKSILSITESFIYVVITNIIDEKKIIAKIKFSKF